MKNTSLINWLSLGASLLGLFLMPTVGASSPVWTFATVASNPPTVTIGPTETVKVKYTVTNQSSKSHNLSMKPIAGITVSGCTIVGPHRPCSLSLIVKASALHGNVVGGPVLCQANSDGSPNPNQCYRPSPGNELNITLNKSIFTVTASGDGHESIIPSSQTVTYDTTASFTVTANTGYTLSPTVGGTCPVGSWNSSTYTTGNIKKGSCSVIFSATLIPTTYTGIYVLSQQGFHTTYSIDNGNTWLPMLNQPGSAVGNDATAGGTFFAINANGAMYITTGKTGQGALFRSANGIVWNPMTTALPNNDTAVSVFALQNTIYVGTSAGYVYSTANNGATWIASSAQPDGSAVLALFVSSNGTIYAGTNNATVYLTTNGGASWSQVGTNQPDGSQIFYLTVDNAGTVYAATLSSAELGAPLSYITDYSGNWNSIGNLSSGDNGGLWSVSALGNTLYVGAGNGSIFYSTNPTSGSATWTPTSNKPDDQVITSLIVNQNTVLSPLFVDTSGVVAVGGGQTSVTVTNQSDEPVTNAHAAFSLSGVTQDSSNCTLVAPHSTCTLKFTSTTPYRPQNLAIIGSNTSNVVDRIALVFSINGYLVYKTNANTRTAYVVDNNDISSNTAWGQNGDNILGITENDTNTQAGSCNGATDGNCDTGKIVATYPGQNYAANRCFNSTTGGVPQGTWYLPSTCELNGGLYLNATTNSFMNCSSTTTGSPATPVTTGIFSLYSLGLLSNVTNNSQYWSSTEYSTNPANSAWTQFFLSNGGGAQESASKSNTLNVRCVQSFGY